MLTFSKIKNYHNDNKADNGNSDGWGSGDGDGYGDGWGGGSCWGAMALEERTRINNIDSKG